MWTQDFTFACPSLKSCPGGSLPSFQPAGAECFVLSSSTQMYFPFYALPNEALCKRCWYWNEACTFPSWMVKYWLIGTVRKKRNACLPSAFWDSCLQRVELQWVTTKEWNWMHSLASLLFSCCLLLVGAAGLCTVGWCKKERNWHKQ